jgi:hypothetical protein
MSFTGTYDTDMYLLHFLKIKELCQLAKTSKYINYVITSYPFYSEIYKCLYDNKYKLNTRIINNIECYCCKSFKEQIIYFKEYNTFAKMCFHGNINLVKWYHHEHGYKFYDEYLYFLLEELCSKNITHVAKWLYENTDVFIMIEDDYHNIQKIE